MKRLIPILLWMGALLLAVIALLYYESDLLWKVQQYNLFLDTPHFFREMMLVPGGFLSYLSCYFTQFFFYPWLGVIMLCGWWLLLMWLTKRTFRISDNWTILTLIPVAILLIANMHLGYWHYFIKLRGYFYVPTIGTSAAVAMLWVFRTLSSKLWCRIAYIVTATALGYPLFGIYALAAVVLMGIWTWRLTDNRKQSAILSAIVLLCVIALPLFCYRYVYYQTGIGSLGTAALPDFIIEESYPLNYIPYYLLAVFFLLLVISYQKGFSSKALQKPLCRWGMQCVIFVALIAGVWHWWYKDGNFHRELAMQRCVELTDWEGVLNVAAKQGDEEPTRAICLMQNLALSRLGRQIDEMYNFPRGSKMNNTEIPASTLYHVFGRMIYYNYGLLNDCHRLCMEEGVEYGWRVEVQEYLARCSLLMGETQAARKFLNQLRHTMFHGKWADAMQELVDHPQQIAQARETGPVSHMLQYKNSIGSDNGQIEHYLMSVLAMTDSNDPYFQEQAVLGAMWMRDPGQFMKRFAQYSNVLPKGSRMPRIFQEAAYLFGKIENVRDLDKYPFDNRVIQTYNAFMKEATKYNDQPVEIGRMALYPFFGNTYFYDYYFMILSEN